MKKLNAIMAVYVFLYAGDLLAALNENPTAWEQVRDEQGIRVFIQEVDDTDIVRAKALTVIKAPIGVVNNILEDIAHRHEWVPYLLQSRKIIQLTPEQRVEYAHFYAPWPASDRDFVYLHNKKIHTEDRVIYEAESMNYEQLPETDDKVRGEIFDSRYSLLKIDTETTQVELVYHADPKGWLPNWIINIIQQSLPYRMLLNLRKRSENELL